MVENDEDKDTMNNNTKKNLLDEYKEIQHLREIWTGSIRHWNQIFIPLSWAILALFITQFPKFKDYELDLEYLIIGCIILSIFLIFWRMICHNIDEQIVNFYPRLLELEKNLDFEMQSSYFFNNLSNSAINFLAFKTENINCEQMKNKDYIEFKNLTKKPKELLLEVWNEYKHKSVNSRGHWLIDLLAFGIIVGYWAIFIIGIFSNWWS